VPVPVLEQRHSSFWFWSFLSLLLLLIYIVYQRREETSEEEAPLEEDQQQQQQEQEQEHEQQEEQEHEQQDNKPNEIECNAKLADPILSTIQVLPTINEEISAILTPSDSNVTLKPVKTSFIINTVATPAESIDTHWFLVFCTLVLFVCMRSYSLFCYWTVKRSIIFVIFVDNNDTCYSSSSSTSVCQPNNEKNELEKVDDTVSIPESTQLEHSHLLLNQDLTEPLANLSLIADETGQPILFREFTQE
jgi:cytoskeletal protein RodZ